MDLYKNYPLQTLLLACIACIFIKSACADEDEQIQEAPIAVRDFLPQAGKWQLGVSYLYANNQTSSVHSGGGIGVTQSSGPDLGQSQGTQTSTDMLIISPGLSYGMSKDTEITTHLSWLAYQTRIQNGDNVYTEGDSRFASANLNISHRFIKDKEKPALFGNLNLTLAEKVGTQDIQTEYASAWAVGLTSYRVYDPILISGAIGYQVFRERTVDGRLVDPGDSVYVNGGINFVPNSDTSLSLGFTWSYKGRDEIDGQKQGIALTTTSLNFGFGYEWSVDTLLFLGVNTVVSGGEGAAISLNTSYNL